MKKLISILLCTAMFLTLAVGCAKTPAATPESSAPAEDVSSVAPAADEPFEIKLGIWPEDSLTEEIALHEQYVKTFNETHPNVTVVPAYYKYATDTFVSLAESGNLPTIYDTWFTEPQKIIANGFAADITENLKAKGWDTAMSEAVKEILTKDGKFYGTPRDGYALGIMCNLDLFKKGGFVADDGTFTYPKTWTELAEMGKKIKEKTGSAGLCLLAKDNAGGWHFSNIAWCFGANLCIEKDGKWTSNLATPECAAAMEYVKSLKWEYDILTADPTNEDWGTGFAQLGTGAAAMYIGANDAVMQPTVNNGLPLGDLAMIGIPAGPDGKQFALSGGTPYMFSPSATSAQIDACLDYLTIMGKSPEASDAAKAGMKADAEYRQANGIPVIPRFPCWVNQDILDAEAAIIKEYSNVNTAYYDSYFESAKKSIRAEEGGDVQKMYEFLTGVMQKVLTDKNADVTALLAEANANYQKHLDEVINK